MIISPLYTVRIYFPTAADPDMFDSLNILCYKAKNFDNHNAAEWFITS